MKKNVILLSCVIFVGAVYGIASAIYNQNPYYPSAGNTTASDEQMFKAWHWKPSPIWMPSYLLCKIAKNFPGNWAGIKYTKSGYLFRSRGGQIVSRISQVNSDK